METEKVSKGQKELVRDLELLLGEAKAGEFGDFTNTSYDAPKLSLANWFEKLRKNVIDGKYDG